MEPNCTDKFILNKDKCLCEKQPTPKKTPKKSPKKPAAKTKKLIVKESLPKKPSPSPERTVTATPLAKMPSPPKTDKGKYCNKRNPQIDDEGFCPDDKPYYDNLSDCCYKTEQGDWHKKNNVKRVFKSRKNKEKTPEKKPKTLKAKVKVKAKDPSPKLIVIKSATPQDDIKLSSSISKAIKETPKDRKTIIKSFSPEVNKLLLKPSITVGRYSIMSNYATPIIAKLSPGERGDTPGSDIAYDLAEEQMQKLYNDPKITLKNGKVVKYNSKQAVDQLLANLHDNKNINCSKVIAPIQWQSNCWFNSGFMINYVSDKGRKFSKYLREAMITGVTKTPDKSIQKKMTPRLHKILFILNLCIEASLSGNKMAYFMDTNFIIKRVFDAIPKKQNSYAVKVGDSGNPTSYYAALVEYLMNDYDAPAPTSIHIPVCRSQEDYDNIKYHSAPWIPDVIIVTIYDKDSKRNKDVKKSEIQEGKHSGSSGKINKKLLEFELDYKFRPPQKPKPRYVLDSVLMRDIGAGHFCSVITCNGKELGFDGESYHRMSSFEWKHLINKDQDWTFEGSNTKWNFRNGYQQLYYYRSDSILRF
tara:strand:+ start:2815 stop:4569 length:1755 start_codon:yes stop_codon:yes gene_type:complete